MKYLVLIFALLLSVPALGANSSSVTIDKPYYKKGTMSFDTTGVECIQINDIRGTYPYVYIGVDETTDGATFDIEIAHADDANETGESEDLVSDSTTDDIYFNTLMAPYICVRLDACTTCAVSVEVHAITGGRK